MIRFIFFCMILIVITFAAVPIFYGVTEQRQKLTQTATIEKNSDELTFDEIYALASEESITNPTALNAIESAAGEIVVLDKFSNGFSGKEDSALADTIDEIVVSEEEASF